MFLNERSMDIELYVLDSRSCCVFSSYFSTDTVGSVNDVSLRLNRMPSVFVIHCLLRSVAEKILQV